MSFLTWSRESSLAPSVDQGCVSPRPRRTPFTPSASIERELVASPFSTAGPDTPRPILVDDRDITLNTQPNESKFNRQSPIVADHRTELATIDTGTLGSLNRASSIASSSPETIILTRSTTTPNSPFARSSPFTRDLSSCIASESFKLQQQRTRLPLIDQGKSYRWAEVANKLRREQEETRSFWHYKNRLCDPRVRYSFDELWRDAIDHYGPHFLNLKGSFLLSSYRYYTPRPLGTIRVSAKDGHVTARKDVRIVMEKGICRTEKLNIRTFHSLISFKYNDICALFVRVVPKKPMMVLFLTRFEGPVVFFFREEMAPRVVLVLMQTQFIEVLQSAVPENAIGKYAIQIFNFAASLRLEEEIKRKRQFFSADLIKQDYPSFFSHMTYPEHDEFTEAEESDHGEMGDYSYSDDNSVLNLEVERKHVDFPDSKSAEPRPPKKRQRHGESPDHANSPHLRLQTVDKRQINSTDLEAAMLETKKQREQKKLARLLERRQELEELIEEQSKIVDETEESFTEIEDRISRLTFSAGGLRENGEPPLSPPTTVSPVTPVPGALETATSAPSVVIQSRPFFEVDMIDMEPIPEPVLEQSEPTDVSTEVPVEKRLARIIHTLTA